MQKFDGQLLGTSSAITVAEGYPAWWRVGPKRAGGPARQTAVIERSERDLPGVSVVDDRTVAGEIRGRGVESTADVAGSITDWLDRRAQLRRPFADGYQLRHRAELGHD
jgi:hypothetical protein